MEKQGVRENPIRRSGYALQGGAQPTQPVRFELASERAGEVQANRTNPRRKGATPTMGVSEVRGGYTGQKFLEKMMKKGGNHTKAHYEHDREGKLLHETMEAHEAEGRAMKGGRAVPSSGLSQFRGGAGIVGGGKACSDSDSDMEGGARDAEVLARESAKRPVIRAGLSDQHSVEAKEMGHHLGKHLMSVRGGGFYDLFTKGIVEAGREGDAVRKVEGIPPTQLHDVAPVAPEPVTVGSAPEEQMKAGGALFHRKKDMLGEKEEAHAEHTARRFGRTHRGGAYDFSRIMPKEEPMRDKEYNLRQQMPQFEKKKMKMGGFKSGEYEGMGASGGGPARRAKRASKTPAEKEHQKKMKHEAQMRMADEALDEEDEGIRQRVGQPLRLEVAPPIHRPIARRAEAHPVGAPSDLTLSGQRMGRGGKKRRAPAGPSDGRRKRADIVKKVMAEKGMKMIEASKYVKAHNLY